MTHEEFDRHAYAVAEVGDLPSWVACFTPDGVFVDTSVAVVPAGILPPTGNRMDAPCFDVFRLTDARIQRFDCYPSGAVILGQLGLLGNLDAVLQPRASVAV